MNIEGVNYQIQKVQFAKVFEEKSQGEKAPTGLIPSAIDASEKILAHADLAPKEIHVDLDA